MGLTILEAMVESDSRKLFSFLDARGGKEKEVKVRSRSYQL
jgi:hypothetical protein